MTRYADRWHCIRLYGNAYGVQTRTHVVGWFPTMEEALAAAKAEGVTFGTGVMAPAKSDPPTSPETLDR